MRRMNATSLRASLLVAFASAALFALGCGPSTPNAEHEHGEHEHGEHEHGEHPKMAGAMNEFHEVLAPLWHADKSPERTKKTCEAVATFETRAAAVDKDVPESARAAEAAYHTAAQGLIAAVGELKTECAKPEHADFEAKFMAVHEAFHKVMESSH
jgi:hypothetical protein